MNAQVNSLAGRFLERTRLDVDRLREIISEAHRGGRLFLAKAKQVAHSIHGAGAMFGFAEISAVGGLIEQLIGDLDTTAPCPEVPCDAALLRELAALTEQLGRLADGSKGVVPSSGMFTERS